ncbi:SDR family NAD(P)-dependent oxidoreductase, partial [bacterium]|nr:SDR family NAD(P)-dependent oxidoreductase [bacterium]
AGYDNGREFDRDRVSVILGVTGAQELVIPLGARLYHPLFRKTLLDAGLSSGDTEEIIQRINHKLVGWQENSFPGLLGNVVAGRVANRFDFGGTNCVVDAACAGSLSSIHMACMELQSGRSDMVVTGGVDSFNDIFMYMCFSKTKALSAKGHARPFDKDSDGTIIGEGVGVVTLKRLEDAEKDGDSIYAVISGLGTSSDGKGNAIYAPSAKGQKKALTRAYEQAGFSPDTIELLEAHGTGTPVGDAIELEALTDIYRRAKPDGRWCALGSIKSQIGHGKAAAGIAGLIKAALAVNYRVLPPTIKVNNPLDPLARKETPFYINSEKRPWVSRTDQTRRAGVSAFGFGGSNYHIVIEEYDKSQVKPDWDGSVQLLAFSASNPKTLMAKLKAWKAPEKWNDLRTEAQNLRSSFITVDSCRLIAMVQAEDQPGAVIKRALEKLETDSNAPWEIPTGIYYGCGDKPGKLAMVFSGQGSQYPNMLRDLACQFPEFIEVLDQSNSSFEKHSYGSPDKRLSDIIYPPSAFTNEEKNSQVNDLQLTQHAQPGLGAVSIAAWRVLNERFGVTVDAAAGHSYGEICALCAANKISLDEFHYLSALRGKLMSDGDKDRGGMAAVTIPLDEIQSVLDEENLELVIANKNAPAQGVISGKTEEIQRAIKEFQKRKMRIIPLKVSAAFHSPLVADASRPFGKHLEKIKFKKGNFPVYSNTFGTEYPKQQKQMREILASQLENPVEFVNEIRQMFKDGIRTFIEVGPGRRMSGLIRSILEGETVYTVSVDQSNSKKSGQEDLARMLGRLAVLGYPITLTAWDETFVSETRKETKKPAMEIMIGGANYIRPKEPLPAFTISSATTIQPGTNGLPTTTHTAGAPSISEAFTAIQGNLTGLQRLQEQTAQLHQQFLASQQEAQIAFQSLIGQQQIVLTGQPPQLIQSPQPIPQTQKQTSEMPAPAAMPSQTLTQILMDVVSEKTGYPIDLLEPEMELDADLGIDSIKRVEILSALQEKLPELPTINPEQMAGIRALNDIIDLLGSTSLSVKPATHITAKKPADVSGSIDKSILMSVVSEKTGYPVDLLEPEMELDADLGIDSIKRVEILSALQEKIPGLPTVSPEKMGSIRTLQDILTTVTMQEAGTKVAQVSVEKKRKKGIFDTQPIGIKRVSSIHGEKEVILGIIAKQTGYPMDLLESNMELEADLGIDSIKRVEILSALQQRFSELPDIQPNEMVEIRTVKDVIGVVGRVRASLSGRPKTAPVTIRPVRDAVPQTAPVVKKPVAEKISAPRPEPKPVPEQKIEKKISHVFRKVHRGVLRTSPVSSNRSRVNFPEHAEIWITRDDCGLSELIFEEFENQFIPCRLVSPDYLEFVEVPDQIAGLIMVGPRDTCSMNTLNKMFELVRLVSSNIRRTEDNDTQNPLIVSIVRLDGSFGLSNRAVDFQPMTAAFSGLAKTVQAEWPESRCKIIDIDADRDFEPDIADLMQELFLEGPLEVGYSSHGKIMLELVDSPIEPTRLTGEPLIPGNWVMLTGGARGVTAMCAIELARRFGVNLLLVGRSKQATDEPDWLTNLEDEAVIKKAIVAQANTKMSPKELNRLYIYHMKNREILRNIEKMKALGVKVRYESVDVTDPAALQAMFNLLKKEKIIIEGVVHGAGILADKLIVEKNPENFDRVIRTKVESLRHISDLLDLDKLKILVLFSSSTARFGRKGQVDYAMANEVLNKFAQKFSKLYPECRTLSFNWGPWDGGMVTPDLKKLFQAEGIEVIDPQSGTLSLSRELRMEFGMTVDKPVELVMLGSMDPDTAIPGDTEPVWVDNTLEEETIESDVEIMQEEYHEDNANDDELYEIDN